MSLAHKFAKEAGDKRRQGVRNVVAGGVKQVHNLGEGSARPGSKLLIVGASANPHSLIRSFLTAALPAASLELASTAATGSVLYSYTVAIISNRTTFLAATEGAPEPAKFPRM